MQNLKMDNYSLRFNNQIIFHFFITKYQIIYKILTINGNSRQNKFNRIRDKIQYFNFLYNRKITKYQDKNDSILLNSPQIFVHNKQNAYLLKVFKKLLLILQMMLHVQINLQRKLYLNYSYYFSLKYQMNQQDDEMEERFSYQQFIKLTEKQTNIDDYSQVLLIQQYQCMTSNHNNKIEAICVDNQCNQLDRKACVQCIQQQLHSIENQLIQSNLKNVNQMIQIISEFKNFISSKIDKLMFQFYYEQMNLAYENNEKIGVLKYQNIKMIDSQLTLLVSKLQQMNVQEYIKYQNLTNIGLYQYLQKYYEQSEEVRSKIQSSQQFKINITNGQNPVQLNQSDWNHFKYEIISIRKQKHLILNKILQTQCFINGNIEEEGKRTIKNYIENLLKNGQKLNDQQQYDLAIEHYDIYLSQNPQNYQAYNQKGLSLYQQQKYEEAIKMYDIAINLKPDDYLAYYARGSTLATLERHQEAIEMFDIAQKLNPSNHDIYNNKGFSLLKINKNEEAIQQFDIAIQLNPRIYEAYNNKEVYDIAIRLNPNSYIIYYNKGQRRVQFLGFCLFKLKEYEQAIQMYDISIKFNPQFAQVYFSKGHSLKLLSRHLEAIEMFDLALKLNPKYRQALVHKGDSLRLLQMHGQAILMYDLALQINPKDYLTLYQKGTSLDSIQQYEQAVLMYDQSIQLNPKYHLAYINKGFSLQALLQFDEAQLMFDQAKKIQEEL